MYYNRYWKIDGVLASFIMRGGGNAEYTVVFERENATLEQIRDINWAHPTVVRQKGTPANAFCLPEGYGYTVEGICYDCKLDTFHVCLKTASQYLGDVTGYVETIKTLEDQAEEHRATIADLEAQLEEADELSIELYEQLIRNESDEDPENAEEEVDE